MLPRRAQDAPRWPQDGAKTRPRVSPKIAQDGYKTRQNRGQDAPRCAQDAPRRAKMRPRRAQDAPRWPQDGAKTRPRRTQDAPERMRLRPICPNMGRRRLEALPRRSKMLPRRPRTLPRRAQDAPETRQRQTNRQANGKHDSNNALPVPLQRQVYVETFLEPKTHQDGPKTAPRWSKTLLRQLSDEKCDKDGHQERQDRIHDGFLSQLGAKMAPVTCEKP